MAPLAPLRLTAWLICALSFFTLTTTALPASAAVLISVNKSTRQISLSRDGVPRYRFAVSTGRAGYGTSSGSYRPQNLSYVDRASQRSGINQDPDHSLCHADQSQQDKLCVVEDTEVSDTGCPKSKK
jgi:hypothetical protein